MKKILLLLIIPFFFLSSCNDITNNDNKTEIWKPRLSSERGDSKVKLNWFNPDIWNEILLPFTWVDPDTFEIYMSSESPYLLNKILTLPNDKKYEYIISNLINGQYYYFSVRAIKNGKEPLISDTIMVIPSQQELIEKFYNNNDFSMVQNSISSDKQIIAYIDNNYSWDNGIHGDPSLFTIDINTNEKKLINIQSYSPDWSPTEQKIVYSTDNGEINLGNGVPQQISLYNYYTNQILKLTTGDYDKLNPEFSSDGKWILYISDENNRDKFEIWKISLDGTQKNKLTNLNLFDNLEGIIYPGKPIWSNDGYSIYYNHSTINEHSKINRINLINNSIEPVFQSIWDDYLPSISPDNTKMAFISKRSGNEQIWLYDLKNGKFKQITNSSNINITIYYGKLEWLTDNKLLFTGFSNHYEGLYSVSID